MLLTKMVVFVVLIVDLVFRKKNELCRRSRDGEISGLSCFLDVRTFDARLMFESWMNLGSRSIHAEMPKFRRQLTLPCIGTVDGKQDSGQGLCKSEFPDLW